MCLLYTVSNTLTFHFPTMRQCLAFIMWQWPTLAFLGDCWWNGHCSSQVEATQTGSWLLLLDISKYLTLSCFLPPCSLVLPQLLRQFLPYISFLCWVLFVSDHYWRQKVRWVPLICHIDIYPKCSFSLFLRMSYCRYSSQSESVFSSQALRQVFLTKRAIVKLRHFPVP